MKKVISILGSTGSIGTQALEVISKLKDDFEVFGLCAGNNLNLLLEQIEQFQPQIVSIKSEESAQTVQRKYPNIKCLYGENALEEIASDKRNDIVLVSLSGAAGLKPTIAAINAGKDIALANKETLVMAGDIIMQLAQEKGVKILPVDSEHSAIFQCLDNHNIPERLIITSSGGPFRTWTKEKIENATFAQALAHPNWSMGKKITIDSATLMNKGLEVIEAHHLFNMPYDKIRVVVHPQSYLHSAVEFQDGSIIGQMGIPSMHIPIQYALTYPNRVQGIESKSFDFVKAAKLEFFEPDFDKFPCLRLAFEAGQKGGSTTVCLNGANEEAVYAFLEGKIRYTDIYKTVDTCLASYKTISKPTISDILSEDTKTRTMAREVIKQLSEKR